jgi:hypothetical protein
LLLAGLVEKRRSRRPIIPALDDGLVAAGVTAGGQGPLPSIALETLRLDAVQRRR